MTANIACLMLNQADLILICARKDVKLALAVSKLGKCQLNLLY